MPSDMRICGNCRFRNPEHAIQVYSLRMVLCEHDAQPRGLVPEDYRCAEYAPLVLLRDERTGT